jgi:threonine dehydratase
MSLNPQLPYNGWAGRLKTVRPELLLAPFQVKETGPRGTGFDNHTSQTYMPGAIKESLMETTFDDIRVAYDLFKGVIHPSPLLFSGYLTRKFGSEVLLKLENLQETGSFKVRGAYNRLLRLDDDEKGRGVIAASAGNHAQGVAWAATKLGIKATIVMPEDVSLRKLMAVREFDCEVILYGGRYDEAYGHAVEISGQTGKILIPGFDDPHIVAGQGTIALEISQMLDEETTIIVSVGGGGLISGIAIAAKTLQPRTRIIGVQTESCPSALRSLECNCPTAVTVQPTLADGIAVNRVGELNFSLIQKYVDGVVAVDEEGIAGAILDLMDKTSIIAEGAGAAPLTALMENKVSVRAKRYILIVSGGNIEINTIDRILQRGSIKMGRRIRIEVNLLDVPGSLSGLLQILAQERANILHIFHDRLDIRNPIQVSRVVLNLETRGPEHGTAIVQNLAQAGYRVRKVL